MAGSWKVATVLLHVATCARTPHPFKQNPPVADILRLTGSGAGIKACQPRGLNAGAAYLITAA
jgi:hypothetical protein